MTFNLPPRIRFVIYVTLGVGGIIVTYLSNTGNIGQNEVELFTALAAFVGGLAALNTPVGDK